jgi:hypothetical protein
MIRRSWGDPNSFGPSSQATLISAQAGLGSQCAKILMMVMRSA